MFKQPLKEYKQEKDGKSTDQPPRLHSDPFTKLSPDTHQLVLSFLGKKALPLRAVSHQWNSRSNTVYWKELKENLPVAELDKRILVSLRLICDRDKAIAQELIFFIVQVHHYFVKELAAHHEKKESVEEEKQEEISDEHYKLFEAIITENIEEFFRITQQPGFNPNYLLCYISPLMIAELSPRQLFTDRLKQLGAELLPPCEEQISQIINRKSYLKQSMQSLKDRPILVDIIVRNFRKEGDDMLHELIEEGLLKDKPYANIVAGMISRGAGQPNEGLFIFTYMQCMHSLATQYGKNSVEMLTAVLSGRFKNKLFYYNRRTSLDSLLLAATLSVHLLRVFLRIYKNCLTDNMPAVREGRTEEIVSKFNLDCLGELIKHYPNNSAVKKSAASKIIKNLRSDRDLSSHITFCSYEERYADIVKTLREFVLSDPEEFVSMQWIRRAVDHDCHEFLHILNANENLSARVANLKETGRLLGDTHKAQTTYEALLELKNIDVNEYIFSRRTPLINVLIELRQEESKQSQEHLLSLTELLIKHPRIDLGKTKEGEKEDAFYYISILGDPTHVERLFLQIKLDPIKAEELLKRRWFNSDVILKVLLSFIKPYSNPKLLATLVARSFKGVLSDSWMHEFRYIYSPELPRLLNRPDLQPIPPGAKKPDIRFLNAGYHTNILPLIVMHPGSNMTYFRMNTRWMEDFIHPKNTQTVHCRLSIDLAEQALKLGKLDKAATHFNEARKHDSKSVDIYIQQVLIKFPEKYSFTSKQREELLLLPGILRSDNPSTLILLAQEHSANHPALAFVLYRKALGCKPSAKEVRFIATKMDLISNTPKAECKEDARAELLKIANIKTNNKKYKYIAHKIIGVLNFGYKKQVERDHLLQFGVELIIQGISPRHPFFAALLLVIDNVRINSFVNVANAGEAKERDNMRTKRW